MYINEITTLNNHPSLNTCRTVYETLTVAYFVLFHFAASIAFFSMV